MSAIRTTVIFGLCYKGTSVVKQCLLLLGSLAVFAGAAELAAERQGAVTVGWHHRLESYLATIVSLTSAERRQLLSGAAVTKLLTADSASEVGIFGAVWIRGSRQRYVASVVDIQNFDIGGSFRTTRKIGMPARREDFRDLNLPDPVDDFRECRVEDCKIKMDRRWIDRLRGVDFKGASAKSDVDALFRDLAYQYVTAYQQEGDRALARYADKPQGAVVAEEFRSMVSGLPLLTFVPAMRQYLLDYPQAPLNKTAEFMYWQDVKFGLKPTIHVNHVVIAGNDTETIVASKMLYATHYFWAALDFRVLVPDPSRGPGFWFVTVSRSRTDGLTGLLGRIVRLRVRREAQQATLNILWRTKSTLERHPAD